MTTDEMLAGEWKMLVEETPADLAPSLSFVCGSVNEKGLPVGTYRVESGKLVAEIGDDVTLTAPLPDLAPLLPGIERVPVNVLSATVATLIPDDEPLIECATLARVISDRVSEAELRNRLAA